MVVSVCVLRAADLQFDLLPTALPPGCFWPGLILSILAAIVASQAMITASFQILSQAMQLCYFPRIRTKFTSTVVHNQVSLLLSAALSMRPLLFRLNMRNCSIPVLCATC